METTTISDGHPPLHSWHYIYPPLNVGRALTAWSAEDTVEQVNAKRQTAENTKPLSVAERKALVAEATKTATGKAKRGMRLIDFREPTPAERAFGQSLDGLADKVRARHRARKAA